MVSVHLLTKQQGNVYTTGCGREEKSSSGMPDDISGWSHDVTCPLCATRLIVHKRLESHEEMTKLIDLDDPNVAKKFRFEGKRHGFRWLIGTPLVYVYNYHEDYSAMLALPIQNFVPEIHGREITYEDAQVTARAWITKHGDSFAATGALTASTSASRKRMTRQPPKPVVPPGYDGPLCAKCGKIDEGDFMPNPANMLEEVCMPCLIKGSK